MKRKWIIPVILFAVILLVGCVVWYFANSSFAISTGRCYVTSKGDYLILVGKEPIEMQDMSSEKALFAGLKTGDEIRIRHGDIMTTYPGKTDVYACSRLREGSLADIPAEILENLSLLGWLPEEAVYINVDNQETAATTEFQDISQNISYQYGFANMALELPSGWAYEIAEYDPETTTFGIHFWPEDVTEGRLRLEYYPYAFGVCGVGLEEKEIRLENGLWAWQGFFDGNPMWDFIAFRDLPGSYVIRREDAGSWWADYQKEAMEIINSMKLGEGIIRESEAVELAALALGLDDKPVRTAFDFCEGIWLIQFEEKGISYNVPVDHEGAVGKISEYDPSAEVARKPVIYLYPERPMQVSVKLDFQGSLTSTYPQYADGWVVTAYPDGTLKDSLTGREYYCLFWEGICSTEYDLSTGFVVPGAETGAFLEYALEQLGLTDREANEFIIYWLPQMEGNPYNLISFQQEAYTDAAELLIDPKPDSLLRVFMAWKPLDRPMDIQPQILPEFERKGFAVVEWGGVCITE